MTQMCTHIRGGGGAIANFKMFPSIHSIINETSSKLSEESEPVQSDKHIENNDSFEAENSDRTIFLQHAQTSVASKVSEAVETVKRSEIISSYILRRE